ncbi:MAG: hypothetical protein QNK89_03045 [Lacinutrix sp.]|uniref:hypothetical protein n=1 Tax=Lacinutrix sp. TaxID=1937692 RepID=UPI0030B38F88
MSQELPSNKNTNEEVDLIVFFNLIGNALIKVFNFIASILKTLFSMLIHTIKVFIDGWKVILGVVLTSAVIGFALEYTKPILYQSDMLVKPYFDSKYQLVNNIAFFNSLISNKDYEQLNNIFNSDSTAKLEVKNLKQFIIQPGPETENDRVMQYQSFVKELDSFGREQLDYNNFIENRSIYTGEIYLIIAKSDKKDIFQDLTYGINSAFTNAYSNSKKIKDTLLYKIQRENIEKSLDEVQKLQAIYIQALQDQSKNPGQRVNAGEFLLTKEKELDTKEYALLDKELALRNQLRLLEEKRVREDVFVDVISSFQPVGSQKKGLLDRHSIVFPVLGFILLCFFYVMRRIINYTNNYED